MHINNYAYMLFTTALDNKNIPHNCLELLFCQIKLKYPASPNYKNILLWMELLIYLYIKIYKFMNK